MKANQCKHFHLGRCTADDAPSKACILMDRRTKGCNWFILERVKPVPLSLSDYQAWAERRVADRRKKAKNNGHKDGFTIPKLKDFA